MIHLCAASVADVADVADATEEPLMKRNVYLRVPDALHHEARVFAATHRKGVNELYLEALRVFLVREAERAAAGLESDVPDA